MWNFLITINQKVNEIFDQYQKSMNRFATISISLVIALSFLYYFIRFQFNLRNEVPLLLYGLAYGLIIFSLFKILVNRCTIVYTPIDLWALVFLFYNIILLPLSFARYGMIEGLYAIKNHLTGLFLYFVMILFFNSKSARFIFKLTMVVCAIVAIVYLAELISVRYGGGIEDGNILSGEVFDYTRELDQYALEIHPTGHGIAKSWTESDSSIFVRLAGPLGHSNASTFVIGMGVILSFALIAFSYPQRGKTLLFMVGMVTLFWGGTRTNMISSFIGILFLALLGISNKKIGFRKIILVFFAGALLITLLISFKVIDWEAYSQVINWEQSLYTVSIILSKSNFEKLLIQVNDNLLYLVVGFGLAPVLPSTFRGVRYNGYPIVNDDAFFIQFLSQYGIIFSLLLFLFIIYCIWASYKMCKQINHEYFGRNLFALAGITAVLISTFISSLHGAAFYRPQINQVIFILLGAYSVIIREGIRAKGRQDLFLVKRFQSWIKALQKTPTLL